MNLFQTSSRFWGVAFVSPGLMCHSVARLPFEHLRLKQQTFCIFVGFDQAHELANLQELPDIPLRGSIQQDS